MARRNLLQSLENETGEKETSKEYFPLFLVLRGFVCPDQEEAVGSCILRRTCYCEPHIYLPGKMEGSQIQLWQNSQIPCQEKGKMEEMGSPLTCYGQVCLSALEMGHLFPDHTCYSRLASSDGLCLWFWECSSRTASMRRKWSILSVEMCIVAFWKYCTFSTTCEYCLILHKIESG